MQSTARDVPTYLSEATPERRVVLERLRALCQEILVGYEEGMDYGMPTYRRNGVPEISFANQKQYISLYVKQDVVEAHLDDLKGLNVGKSCIRFKKPEHINFDVVRSMFVETVASAESSS